MGAWSNAEKGCWCVVGVRVQQILSVWVLEYPWQEEVRQGSLLGEERVQKLLFKGLGYKLHGSPNLPASWT